MMFLLERLEPSLTIVIGMRASMHAAENLSHHLRPFILVLLNRFGYVVHLSLPPNSSILCTIFHRQIHEHCAPFSTKKFISVVHLISESIHQDEILKWSGIFRHTELQELKNINIIQLRNR